MNSIYIVYTPYHLLIACGYASKYDDANEKYLVIVSDFANAERYFDAVSHWDSCPFITIDLLPGRYNCKKHTVLQVLLNRANGIRVQKYFNENITAGCTAYIFNDANIEGQVAALENKKLGGCNIYMEDGFAAYGSGRLPHLDKTHHLLAKLIYGDWYQNVEVLGKSAHIDRVMVFHPNSIRSELKSTRVSQLPRDILTKLDLGLRAKILKNLNAEVTRHQYDVLIILPHSSYARRLNILNVKRVYSGLIKEMKKLNYSVGIKYHPRETESNYLGIDVASDVSILPQDIPIEVLFCGNDGIIPPKFVIGDSSTGLITARIILGEKTVILSVSSIIDLNTQISNVFEKMDIIQPKTLDELRNYIFDCGV